MKLMSVDELVVSCCFILSIQRIYGTPPTTKKMGSWKVPTSQRSTIPFLPASVLPVIASPPAMGFVNIKWLKKEAWEIPRVGVVTCFFEP